MVGVAKSAMIILPDNEDIACSAFATLLTLGFYTLHVKKRVGGALPDEVEADGILQTAGAEEGEDAFAMLELALEVGVDVVFKLGRDVLLAIVIPVGIDAHKQV